MAERVRDGARHRRVRRRRGVGVHHPELDVVADLMEPDQVGADVAAAVNPELADPLRQLRHHEVVVVELLRLEREVGVFPLEVRREQACLYTGVLGHLGEGFPGEVLLGAVGLGATAGRRGRRRLDDADGAGGGNDRERDEQRGTHRVTPEGQKIAYSPEGATLQPRPGGAGCRFSCGLTSRGWQRAGSGGGGGGGLNPTPPPFFEVVFSLFFWRGCGPQPTRWARPPRRRKRRKRGPPGRRPPKSRG